MKAEKALQVPQGNPPAAPRLPPRRRLKSAQDLRVFLSDLVNRTNRGEVEPGLARCLGYLGQVLSGIINTSDIEKRLSALEAQAKENHK